MTSPLKCASCQQDLSLFPRFWTRMICCGAGMHPTCIEKRHDNNAGHMCPNCQAPGPSGNPEEMLKLVTHHAELGASWAQNALGDCYRHGGMGLEQNLDKAKEYWALAGCDDNIGKDYPLREIGSIMTAGYNLACLYYEGTGEPRNLDLARVWFEKSANLGYPSSQWNVGYMYENGEGGLSVSIEKARSWYEKSAHGKDPQGMCDFAKCLLDGGPEDATKARHWFEQVILQGPSQILGKAQLNLAQMLIVGKGGSQNLPKGMELLTSVAKDDPYRYGQRAVVMLNHFGSQGAPLQCFSCCKFSKREKPMKKCPGCKSAFYCGKYCKRRA